ncbi:minor capsid protein [Weissella tructae]
MANYWEERSLRVKQNQLDSSKQYEHELKARMSGVEEELAKQVEKFVSMYANAKDVSIADAITLLSKQETHNWAQSIEVWGQMAVAPEYEYLYRKKMDAEYAKAQLTRLEAIERQIYEILAKSASTERQYFEGALSDVYAESYYRQVFDIQDQQGVYSSFQTINETALKTVVAQRWQGSDFSSRLWGNYTETLPSYLTSALTRGVTLGYGVDEMVREAKTVFRNFNNNQIHRLIYTEMGHVQETATEMAYKETDLEQYRYLATLESKTCDVCGGLDYKIFNVKDIERGTNYPLIHPNCRCTTTPWIPEMEGMKGTRFARDPETGERTKVPKMSFDDWKKWQIDISSKDLVGLKTPDNVEISGVSLHIKERMFERNVDKRHVSDAIKNPLQIKDKAADELGRKSRKYIGEHATIAINPDTGYLLTTYPTGSSTRRRLLNARKDSN